MSRSDVKHHEFLHLLSIWKNKQKLLHRKTVSCLVARPRLSHLPWMWRLLLSPGKQIHPAFPGSVIGFSGRTLVVLPASRNRTCISESQWLWCDHHTLTLFFSLSPRNFSTTYITMTKNSQSHLLPSQLWVCSGRFCLIRKCPPQGTFPGLSLVFSLSEENMKAQAQEMHRGRNRNHLSVRMVSRGGAGSCSWWVCLPPCQRDWGPSVGSW